MVRSFAGDDQRMVRRAQRVRTRAGSGVTPVPPVGWPPAEVRDGEDDQLSGLYAVHHCELEPFGEDTPRAKLPGRAELGMDRRQCRSNLDGLAKPLAQTTLALLAE